MPNTTRCPTSQERAGVALLCCGGLGMGTNRIDKISNGYQPSTACKLFLRMFLFFIYALGGDWYTFMHSSSGLSNFTSFSAAESRSPLNSPTNSSTFISFSCGGKWSSILFKL